jgi:hypothetical protein
LRLNVSVSGKLRDVLAQKGIALQDAGNAAVVRQTDETKGEMRVQIAQRLSPRAANALTSKRIVNPPAGGQAEGEVVGYIHSRWFRRSKATGQNVDLFAAFERGDVIRPVRGKFLAVPLPAAYSVAGIGRKRPTPVGVETALGVKLFQFTSKRGNRFLAITPDSGAVTLGRGRRAKIKPVRFIKTAGGRSFPTSRRGAVVRAPIPMFLLLRNSKLPKRLDFAATRAKSATRLGEKLLVELARREAR